MEIDYSYITALEDELKVLRSEIVELQDAIHNLTAALLDGVFDWLLDSILNTETVGTVGPWIVGASDEVYLMPDYLR